MLEKIDIKNFKSHKDTHLDMNYLTVLCGQNGVGKSSVFQTLLALRQSHQKNRLQDVLDLNRPLCYLGSAFDALCYSSEVNSIEFSLQNNDGNMLSWEFEYDDNNRWATYMKVIKHTGNAHKLSLFNNNFQYLSASRLAPQESYPKDDFEVERNRQISIERGKGELVAHFLHHYGKRLKVKYPELRHPTAQFDDLSNQTTAWEKEISKGANVIVESRGTDFELKYNFDIPGALPTPNFKAENVGFGLSYTLPIIVAILSAEKDSLILIENPEAHLHPYGQAKITELMCRAAQAGIQILVETHSDHIINGILVGCKKFEQTDASGIDPKRVSIYYFDREDQQHTTVATKVNIVEGGKIANQPIGFFDQIEHDLQIIMGF